MKPINIVKFFVAAIAVITIVCGQSYNATAAKKAAKLRDAPIPSSWKRSAETGRVLSGTQNNPNPAWIAVTDRDVYFPGETLDVEVKNNDYKRQKIIKNVWIEQLFGKKWGNQVKIDIKGDAKTLKLGETTNFEWEIPQNQPVGKYRLIIFTSKDFSIPPVYSNEFVIK